MFGFACMSCPVSRRRSVSALDIIGHSSSASNPSIGLAGASSHGLAGFVRAVFVDGIACGVDASVDGRGDLLPVFGGHVVGQIAE